MGGLRRGAGRDSIGRTDPERAARSRSSRFPKLKPGPGRSPEQVAAHQRGRLQAAMVELVTEDGYGTVTVAKLTTRASVSKRDFYKHYSGKEECFLATYDVIARRSVRGILVAAEAGRDWRERLRLGFLAFANQLVESPDAACLALVHVFAAGQEAAQRMMRVHGLFEALVAKNFARAEGGAQLPPLVVKGIVAGGARTARARLVAGQAEQLRSEGDELMEWALSFCDESVTRLRELTPPERPPPASVAPLQASPGDERGLIVAATARLASRDGYYALTVPAIRAAAGVSRPTFDAHFDGVADAFLATLDELGRRALVAALPAYSDGDWAESVHVTIAALCERLAADPGLARMGFLEVFSPGAEGMSWRASLISRLARLLRRNASPAQQPTEFAAEASIGAIWGVMHHYVATDRTAVLPRAAPTLSYLALAPAIGAAAAIEAIAAASTGPADADLATPPA